MTRYFFDLRDGSYYPDETGTVMPSMKAAKCEAARRIAGLLQADPEKFWAGDEWEMEVKDETGLIFFSICIIANEAAAIRRTS